jgi:alpha-beta hydrolase superfamily lysophospholipase
MMIDLLVPKDVDTLRTADGCTLRRRLWSASATRATVVLVHGFAASTNDAAVVSQAEALQADGFDVVSYDSRGHGGSGGLCTLGDLESHDVAAALVSVTAAGLPIVLVGASMGAIAVLRAAAMCGEGLAGVVSISCPAAWRAPRSAQGVLAAALTQTRLGRVIASRGMKVRLSPSWSAPEPPCELVRRIAVPVAIIHGDSDHFVATKDGVEIYRNCRPPRRLDLVPGMGHAYGTLALPAVSAAVEWVLAAHESAGLGMAR